MFFFGILCFDLQLNG